METNTVATNTAISELIEELLERVSDDLILEFEERAGIMEYDGRLTRVQADVLAFLYLLKNHPAALLPSYTEINQTKEMPT